MAFRIRMAFGSANFDEFPKLDPWLKLVCSHLKGELQNLKNDIEWAESFFIKNPDFDSMENEVDISGRKIQMQIMREELKDGQKLFVLQCFVPTWKNFNYITFWKIGRMMADGVVLNTDKSVSPAKDEDLWFYR